MKTTSGFCPVCQNYRKIVSREGERWSSGRLQCGECRAPLRLSWAAESILVACTALLIFFIGGQFFFENGKPPSWSLNIVYVFVAWVVLMIPFSYRMRIDHRKFDDKKNGQMIFTVILIMIVAITAFGLLSSL